MSFFFLDFSSNISFQNFPNNFKEQMTEGLDNFDSLL